MMEKPRSSMSAVELMALASLQPGGTVDWRSPVTCSGAGVYVICVPDPAAIDVSRIPPEHSPRWQADQQIVYVGRATCLSKRLGQFYSHVYGRRAPHRGGQAILELHCVAAEPSAEAPILQSRPRLIVHWAEASDEAAAEHALIEAFRKHAGRMPFGNLRRSARRKAAAHQGAVAAAVAGSLIETR